MPSFSAYKDVKDILDPETKDYFNKWMEMVTLEQNANNVNLLSQYNTLSLGDKGAIKDMNL